MNSNRSRADPLRPPRSIIYSTDLLSKLTRKKKQTEIAHARLEEEDFRRGGACRLVRDNYSLMYVTTGAPSIRFASPSLFSAFLKSGFRKNVISVELFHRIYICIMNSGSACIVQSGLLRVSRPRYHDECESSVFVASAC